MTREEAEELGWTTMEFEEDEAVCTCCGEDVAEGVISPAGDVFCPDCLAAM